MTGYVTATYLVHDARRNFQAKAEGIALGMTIGSWTAIPAAQKAKMQKHAGQVVEVSEHPPIEGGLPVATIKIAYPEINFSADIPALLTTVFGKLSMDGKIKLLDIEFSASFLNSFKGPKFGIEGIRKKLQVDDRPLLMSIFKSCIGQDLDSLAEQFYQQALGGVDLIKDDELIFENPLSPYDKRLEVALAAAEKAKEQTGQETLYALNLTGPVTELADKAKRAVELGANAFLFNVLTYGFDVLQRLSEDPDIPVPIMAHPALAGAFYASPEYGLAAPLLLGKLMRLAGADLVLFPSPYGSVAMERSDTLQIAQYLREDWPVEKKEVSFPADPPQATQNHVFSLKPSFPVPSAGIHPGITALLYEDFGLESVINAGGGIHGHPGGAAAGGQAFRQAISILTAGGDLAEQAESYPELKVALDTWGLVRRES